MSPKPVDVRRALETLRAERPTPEATDRAHAALYRPSLPLGRGRGGAPRRSLARPLTALMITAALAAVVFSPRARAGAAWAQTLAATLDVPSHAISRWPNGNVAEEEWRSGRKHTTVLGLRNGEVQVEMRTDGRRSVNFFDFNDAARRMKAKLAPNARKWAMVSRYDTTIAGLDGLPRGAVQTLLSSPDVKVLGHEEAHDGRPETYHLHQTVASGVLEGVTRDFTAEIDPQTRRIRAIVEPQRTLQGTTEAFRTEIDYPSYIPDDVFAPRLQTAKDVETYDYGTIEASVQRTLRHGLGKQGPVTLRLVTLDGDGVLSAFWTGALPNARMSHPIRLPGVPATGYATRKALTTDWKPNPDVKLVSNVTGQRLGGMSLVPQRKLGLTVDLDVPYLGGVARFRKVPVLRIGLTSHVEEQLGVIMVYIQGPQKKVVKAETPRESAP